MTKRSSSSTEGLLKREPTRIQTDCSVDAALLRDLNVQKLLEATMTQLRPKRRVKHSAADSTGFDTHHVSRYFIWRTHCTKDGKQTTKQVSYKKFGKLMILICCAIHLVLTAVASAGPTPDIDQLEGLMAGVPHSVRIERLVADAGFDSASNHRLLREEHGIASIIPPRHGRPSKDPAKLPSDPYRQLMKTRFNQKAYRHRPQANCIGEDYMPSLETQPGIAKEITVRAIKTGGTAVLNAATSLLTEFISKKCIG